MSGFAPLPPGLSVGESLTDSNRAPVTSPPPPPPPPVDIPVLWLLTNGSASTQHTLIQEYGIGSALPPAALRYAARQGWQLLGMHDGEGMWPGGWLTVPTGAHFAGIGTIPAVRRLLALGWDPEGPPLAAAKRQLFRLLAEDADPTVLAELRPADDDEAVVRRGRLILREAAAATLAEAGYAEDPRVRGAALRLVQRVGRYLASPLAEKPWVRVGNQQVLPEEAAPPSYWFLLMLAAMPQIRSESHAVVRALEGYLARPWPRQLPVQQVGGQLLPQPELVLGDPLASRHELDADTPSAVAWLDLMARLGFLPRHEGWQRWLDQLLHDRDRAGLWHPPRSMALPQEIPAWAWSPLGIDDHPEPATALAIDLTRRLGTIARRAGRVVRAI